MIQYYLIAAYLALNYCLLILHAHCSHTLVEMVSQDHNILEA